LKAPIIYIFLCLFFRSKKETERLHQLHKPIRKPKLDDLPSVDSHDEDSESWGIDIGDPGLPIKLSDGRIEASKKVTVASAPIKDDEETEESVRSQSPTAVPLTVEDVATGARFGRPAVVDVIGNSSRKARIQGAKDQIASICQDIIADPENSVRFHRLTLVFHRLIW